MSDFDDDIAGLSPSKPGAPSAPPPPTTVPKSDLDDFEDSVAAPTGSTGPQDIFKADALADAQRLEAEAAAKAAEAAAKTGALLKKGILAGASATATLAGQAATAARETDPVLRRRLAIGAAIGIALVLAGIGTYSAYQANRDWVKEEAEAGLGFERIPGDVEQRYARATRMQAMQITNASRVAWLDRVAPPGEGDTPGITPETYQHAWAEVMLVGGGWDYCLHRQRDRNAQFPSEPDEFQWDVFEACLGDLMDGSPKANAILARERRWTPDQHVQVKAALDDLCTDRGTTCREVVGSLAYPWRDCRDQQTPDAFKVAPFKACVDQALVRPAEVAELLITKGVECDRQLPSDQRAACNAWVAEAITTLPQACAKDLTGAVDATGVTNCITAKWAEAQTPAKPAQEEPEPVKEVVPVEAEAKEREAREPVRAAVNRLPHCEAKADGCGPTSRPTERPVAPQEAARPVTEPAPVQVKPKPVQVQPQPVQVKPKPVRVAPQEAPAPEPSAEEQAMEAWFEQLEAQNQD